MRVVAWSALVAAVLLCAAVRPAPVAAATPCWKTLLADWYDGRIDNAYPIHCYKDAIRHLPADVQTYSSARDDIMRALQSAEARLKRSGHKVTPNTQVPPSSSPSTGPKPKPTKTGTSPITDTSPVPTTPSPGRTPSKGLSHLADKLNPSSPSALPLPLLVLGALALLLVAAGGAGLLVKRHQQGRNPAP